MGRNLDLDSSTDKQATVIRGTRVVLGVIWWWCLWLCGGGGVWGGVRVAGARLRCAGHWWTVTCLGFDSIQALGREPPGIVSLAHSVASRASGEPAGQDTDKSGGTVDKGVFC